MAYIILVIYRFVLSLRRERERYLFTYSIYSDIELRKAAKVFANKFACGSSVVKNNQGNEEIVVQGDVSDDLYRFIVDTWPNVIIIHFISCLFYK